MCLRFGSDPRKSFLSAETPLPVTDSRLQKRQRQAMATVDEHHVLNSRSDIPAQIDHGTVSGSSLQ